MATGGVVNADLVRQFHQLVELMKLDEGSAQAFRVRAYEKAAQAIENQQQDLRALSKQELQELPGIGKSTAEKIVEFYQRGEIAKVAALRERYPPPFVELTRIPGVGPKTAVRLRDALNIHNVEDLKAAIEREALRDLPGLGAKSEAKIAKSIERLGLHGKDRRTPIADAMPVASQLVAEVVELPGVTQAEYCGSLRRFSDTIGDVDIVVASKTPGPIMDWFVSHALASDVLSHGETKSAILTDAGLQVDLRVVAPAEYGSALLYFTGSKAHNIALRQRAIDKGWLLNEYALADADTEKRIASKTEKAIYRALDLPFIPPQLREDSGEIAAAVSKKLPRLVTVDDLRGDLHVHSDWSGDGRSSLEDMVAAEAARGLEYVALTDHGENLTMNGLSRDRMIEQREALASLQNDHPDLRLLHGCELNIAPDGSVDYDAEFLAGFEYGVASVHSHFDLDSETQTKRIITAMMNPAVNAIGHLSGRRIGKRPGIEFHVEPILEAAELTGTAIEINGHLQRLDATEEVLLQARGSEVVFVIDTDAHHTSELQNAEWGALHARRGWVEKKSVANTWPLDRFLSWVEAKRG